MGQLLRNNMSIRQDMADFALLITARFSAAHNACHADGAAAGLPFSSAVDCLHCYPSPDRFASSWRLPVAPFCAVAKNGWRVFAGLAFSLGLADSAGIITPKKGRNSCLSHLTSSLQLQCFPSLLASRTMQSAHSLALALAVLLAKLSATTTALKAHLLAASSAHLQTTSKVAFLNTTKTIETAAADQPCARRFCF